MPFIVRMEAIEQDMSKHSPQQNINSQIEISKLHMYHDAASMRYIACVQNKNSNDTATCNSLLHNRPR